MTVDLRPYQSEAVAASVKALAAKRNGVVSAPTGSGKSLIIAGLAVEMGAKTVVLQPTKEILEQNFRKLYEFGHLDMDVFSASMGRKRRGQITFATIGSIITHMDSFADTDLIIVDECHLVNAKDGQYKTFIEQIGSPALGLTATPYRMSASFRGSVVEAKFLHRTRPRIFDNVVHVTQSDELHRDGYLCPISYIENEDYNAREIKLNTTGLNYDERALAAYNKAKSICRKAANTVINNYDAANHFLIFVSLIEESKEVERLLENAGISVAHLDGQTPKREREQILEGFQSGKTKVVTNAAVLTTGYDFPALDGIVLAKPTMSLPLHYQMIGRGVRTFPNKEGCKVFDLCGNVARFGKPDEYRIEADDGYKYRLRSGKRYLTGVNFVTGRDIEQQRARAAAKKKAERNETISRDTAVPFGKHAGIKIADLPTGYLEWCSENFSNDKWKTAFSRELSHRRCAAKNADNEVPF